MGSREAAEPTTLRDLSDHLLTEVLRQLEPGWRRQAASTCGRWARIIASLRSGLHLDRPAATVGGDERAAAALLAALARGAPHICWLRCRCESAADVEWQAHLCGLLAGRLLRLQLLRAGGESPLQAVQWLAGMPQLQELVLERSVASMPSAVACLTSLTRLVVVCAEFDFDTPTHLPPGLSQLTALRTMWLEDCMVAPGCGAALGALAGLRSLALRNCLLPEDVAGALGQLANLTSLGLSGSGPLIDGEQDEAAWDGLPLTRLTGLQVLGLSRCGLVRLPRGIAGLTALHVLSAAGNGLEAYPDPAGLPRLEALDVCGNLIEQGLEAFWQGAGALRLLVDSGLRRQGGGSGCCVQIRFRGAGGEPLELCFSVDRPLEARTWERAGPGQSEDLLRLWHELQLAELDFCDLPDCDKYGIS